MPREELISELDWDYKNYNEYAPLVTFGDRIDNYGDAERFAQEIFYSLNGRINPHRPASRLIFDVPVEELKDLSYMSYGYAMGSMVAICIHTIIYRCKKESMKSNEDLLYLIKGTILYTIVHELLHMEQDMSSYFFRYNYDSDKAMEAIENSCHNRTNQLIKWMYDSGIIFRDFKIDVSMITPGISNFVEDNSTIEPYTPIVDPSSEAIWMINVALFGDTVQVGKVPYIYKLIKKYDNILLTVMDENNSTVKMGYLVYNRRPVSFNELYFLLDPFFYASISFHTFSYKYNNAINPDYSDSVMVVVNISSAYLRRNVAFHIPPQEVIRSIYN